VIWELVGRFAVTDQLFFVPFSDVMVALSKLATSGELPKHLYYSGAEFGGGFGLAAVVGVPCGIAIGASKRLNDYTDPIISALYATPLVALTPFYILAFGIGITSKIALAFTLAVFPVIINTATGIQVIDRGYKEVASAFRLSRRQKFVKLLIPASLPYIISGLRLAAGRALIGVVVGELFFASAGVGYLISISAQTFDTATLLAGVVIFAVAGVIVSSSLRWLERKLSPWRQET
jgi:NitT/TauT family transport system permease protein